MVCAPRNARSINEISKETTLQTLDPHFLAPTPFGVAKVFRTRVNLTKRGEEGKAGVPGAINGRGC